MSRSRNIKPGFFENEELAACQPLARILFAGLWTVADRAGRLEDRPLRIKAKILPYDECDCNALLDELAQHQFIVRYVVDGKAFIAIPCFSKHQNPHIREAASSIPEPEKHGTSTVLGTEKAQPSPADSLNLIPDSLNTDSLQKTSVEPSVEVSPLEADQEPEVVTLIRLPLNTGDEFAITDQHVAEFASAYPAVDIMQELRSMRAWCIANPTNRKTKRGILKFVNTWLAKAQDKPKGNSNGTHQPRESASGRAERIGNEHLARIEAREAEGRGDGALLAAHGRDLRA